MARRVGCREEAQALGGLCGLWGRDGRQSGLALGRWVVAPVSLSLVSEVGGRGCLCMRGTYAGPAAWAVLPC